MTAVEFGLLTALSAWVAVDGAAFGQFLISRPLVSGVLTGVILGDPVTGGLVGGALELLFLARLPVGAAHVPEPGPAAIPAVALAAGWPAGVGAGPGGAGALAAAVVLGIVAAWAGGRTVTWQRRLNGRVVERMGRRARAMGTAAPRGRDLGRAIRVCLAIDVLRGAALGAAWLGLVALSFGPFSGGLAAIAGGWTFPPAETLALIVVAALTGLGQLVRIGSSGGGGAAARASHGRKGAARAVLRPLALVVAGIGCGVLVALLAGVPGGAAP